MNEIIDKDGNVFTVTRGTYQQIKLFQKPCVDWSKLNDLLLTKGDRGKFICGDVLHNWKKECEENPELSDDILRLGKLNSFNTVMEFDAVDLGGRLVRKSVLFQINSYERYVK